MYSFQSIGSAPTVLIIPRSTIRPHNAPDERRGQSRGPGTTIHGGIPELVTDRQTGRLVPERDVDALAAAVQDLVDRPDAARRYAEAGRAFVEAHHHIDILNDRLIRRFDALAA